VRWRARCTLIERLWPVSGDTSRRQRKRATSTMRRPNTALDTETSVRLSKVRRRDTSAELAVRRILFRGGLRYRITNRDLPGSPDIANRSARWAVFVHGCFWHHHEGCARATVPRNNRTFWLDKFTANAARDARVTTELRQRGYKCIVVWECEVIRTPRRVRRRLLRVLTLRSHHANE
jgi:DNA mismatch endonuclease (patch repair protein)